MLETPARSRFQIIWWTVPATFTDFLIAVCRPTMPWWQAEQIHHFCALVERSKP